MVYQHTTHKTFLNKAVNEPVNTINTEQFNQIIEAILAGKYSWACVLLLRFSGHNPLHYIPYRTYNRIVKDNRQANRLDQCEASYVTAGDEYSKSSSKSARKLLSGVNDLAYLELLEQQAQIRGRGSSSQSHSCDGQTQEDSSIKAKLWQYKDKIFAVFNW